MSHDVQWYILFSTKHFEEHDRFRFLGHRLEWLGGNNKNKTHIPALYHRVIHPHTAAVISIFAWAFLSPQHSERDGGILQNVKNPPRFPAIDPLICWALDLSIWVSNKGCGENDP